MGSIRVGLFAFTYYLNSLIDVTSNQMRGLGKSVVPMVISLAGICGIRMIWIFTYFKTHRTYEVLLFSYPISWAFTLAALTVLYIITYRKLVKERRHE